MGIRIDTPAAKECPTLGLRLAGKRTMTDSRGIAMASGEATLAEALLSLWDVSSFTSVQGFSLERSLKEKNNLSLCAVFLFFLRLRTSFRLNRPLDLGARFSRSSSSDLKNFRAASKLFGLLAIPIESLD
jgi:hypothetical protein